MDESADDDFKDHIESLEETIPVEITLNEDQTDWQPETDEAVTIGPEGCRFTNSFYICKLLYRYQQVEPSVDVSIIRSDSRAEFIDNVFQLIQPMLKREIEFLGLNQPCWSVTDVPTRDDLGKFVAFKDKEKKKSYRLEQVTERLLHIWKRRDIILQVYVYGNSIDSKGVWDIVRQMLLNEVVGEVSATKRVVKPMDEEQRLQSIEWKLEKFHHATLKPLTNDAYNLWARFVLQHPTHTHKMLISERPPKKLQQYFEDVRRKSTRKRTMVLGPAQRSHTTDGFGFEDEVIALRQTVIQMRDLVDMMDRRVGLLEEKCHGFNQSRQGVAGKRRKFESDGESEEEEMGEENEEPVVDMAPLVQVDCNQGGSSGFPDPLFPEDYVKEETEEIESDG